MKMAEKPCQKEIVEGKKECSFLFFYIPAFESLELTPIKEKVWYVA